MTPESRTAEEVLAAIRKRDAEWAAAEFDGTHQHPETQCPADHDRHFLLAAAKEHGLVIGEGELDVDRLRRALYAVSVRHDWDHTVDRIDRTEEIAAEYERPRR